MRMPSVGAANSSSRVAIEKRPMRISWKNAATTSATNAPTYSQPLPRMMGMPDSPPAPRVSSFQFFTSCSTTNSSASVIIVGARPWARQTATPSSAPMITVTATANRVPSSAFMWTPSRPNGMSGSDFAFAATGMTTTAVAYDAIWAKAM